MKERMEKPGKLAELVAPESAAPWRDFMKEVAFALLHHDDMYQRHRGPTVMTPGGFSNICTRIILFCVFSEPWSPVSPECLRFHFPSNSMTVSSDS